VLAVKELTMLIRKILFPTDFSDASDAPLATASSLARDNNSKLLIVHVHEPNVVYAEGLGAAYGALSLEQREDSKALLESVKPAFPGIDVERRLLDGAPADAIVDFARSEEGVDLIVMGTHGRTGITRLLMGSVAEAIVRKAPCPVLTMKEPAKESDA
jgi:nucleotide-binding universal stress UspA family protein